MCCVTYYHIYYTYLHLIFYYLPHLLETDTISIYAYQLPLSYLATPLTASDV